MTARFKLSASRAKLYERCPAAYRFRYVEKRQQKTSPAMEIGKAIHKAIEIAAKDRAGDASPLEREEFIERLGDVLTSYRLDDEHKARALEIARGAGKIDLSHILGVEEKFEIPLSDDLALFGYIDLIRGSSAVVEIIDWKTGSGQPPTKEELEVDLQAGFYLVAAKRLYPDADVITCTMVYLAQHRAVTVEWTPELDRFFVAMALAIYRMIRAEQFEARAGAACATCDYRGHCAAFEDFVEREARERKEYILSGLDDQKLVELRQRCSSTAKVLESWRKEIDEEITRRLADGPLDVEDYRVSKSTRKVRKIDLPSLCEVADELGVEPLRLVEKVATYSVSKLDKEVRYHDAAKARLEALIDVRRSAPAIRITEV